MRFDGFSKNNLDLYFRELSKELKKELGKYARVEVIIVGGASVLLNYNFRNSTQDIDAFVSTKNSIKRAVNTIGDKYELPNGWLNQDFTKTKSFSPTLIEISKHYKTYNGVLSVRTIEAEYLIAMKLRSLRDYKVDKSDIIGIINEHNINGSPIGYDNITNAFTKLYGNNELLPERAKAFLNEVYAEKDLNELYNKKANEEKLSKNALIEFENNYPDTLNENNLQDILDNLKKKDSSLADDSLQSALVRFIKSSEFSDDSESKEWAIINNQPNSLAVIKHNGDAVCTLYADNYGGIYVRSNDSELTRIVVNIFNENGAKAFVDSINRANNIGL